MAWKDVHNVVSKKADFFIIARTIQFHFYKYCGLIFNFGNFIVKNKYHSGNKRHKQW